MKKKKGDEVFTPARGKFVTSDQPVFGWVKASVPIDRGPPSTTAMTRAVVIGDRDRVLLKELREYAKGADVMLDDDGKRIDEELVALLNRLIGR